MRLIDADSIPWLVEGVGEIPVITKEEIDQLPTIEAPTVGESVGVIRCKDCKQCQNSTVLICGKPNEIFYCDGARKMAVAPYDYCSWAERKEQCD